MDGVCVHSNDKNYSMKEVDQVRASSVSMDAIVTHATTRNEDALNNQVWDDSETIYWTMETDYPHIEGRKFEEKMVKLALLESSMTTPLVIRKRNRKSADSQIKINWLGKKDEKYFTSASTLAFAYGPGRGLGGNCTMNADVAWGMKGEVIPGQEFEDRFDRPVQYHDAVKRYKVYDALHTLKHEIGGHALGMRHLDKANNKYNDIMYPYYNGKRSFGPGDLEYLHRLYGKANINHRIREILMLRILGGVF